jgi:hypothetical protein
VILGRDYAGDLLDRSTGRQVAQAGDHSSASMA